MDSIREQGTGADRVLHAPRRLVRRQQGDARRRADADGGGDPHASTAQRQPAPRGGRDIASHSGRHPPDRERRGQRGGPRLHRGVGVSRHAGRAALPPVQRAARHDRAGREPEARQTRLRTTRAASTRCKTPTSSGTASGSRREQQGSRGQADQRRSRQASRRAAQGDSRARTRSRCARSPRRWTCCRPRTARPQHTLDSAVAEYERLVAAKQG